jgi:nitrite reductase (NADH) small subunit
LSIDVGDGYLDGALAQEGISDSGYFSKGHEGATIPTIIVSVENEIAWLPVASLQQVKAHPTRVRVNAQWIGLYWHGEELFALEDECPHASAPLTDGTLHSDGVIECALHGWRYQLLTGQSPLAYQGCVRTFPVRAEGDVVFVQVSNAPTNAS